MKNKILLISLLMLLIISPSIKADDEIKIIANGKNVEFALEQKPFIEDGSTLIPMRIIFELLDADVKWDKNTSKATATKTSKIVEVQNDSRYIRIDGKISEMPIKAQIVNGYMFLPLRVVSEALGANINWDSQTKTVTIEDYALKKYNQQSFKVENEAFKKVAEQVDTVVSVDILDCNDEILSSFSGVVVSENGYIATNFLSDSTNVEKFRITFINNKTVFSDKFYYNDKKGIFVLKVNKNNLKAAKISKDKEIKIAEPVVLVSNPINLKHTLTDGLISGFVAIGGVEYIQSTASIASSSSGGGLFDYDGNLVGIEKIGGGADVNLFIRIVDIIDYIKSLKN